MNDIPPNPMPDAKELPPPEALGAEAEAFRVWVHSVVDARVLELIPLIRLGMAEGVYAESVDLLRATKRIAQGLLGDRPQGDEQGTNPDDE